ncbi:serine/threonine protein kinase [Bradyrhizobium sp. S3.9.1]
MPSYCCFFCPAATYRDSSLEDPCPTCGRPYGFPLSEPPSEIGQYRILRPLGRGFYAATYVAERKTGLRNKSVLKVTPKAFYEFFAGKNFEEECLLHRDVAEGTEHLVKIRDMQESVDVMFGRDILPCCVAELAFVDGPLLEGYFDKKERVTAAVAAQIAIDLLRLREELEHKQVFHNDLHAGNIIVEKLKKDSYRADAIDSSIRAVAIDLGSAAIQTKSDPTKHRQGDISRIAEHIARLSAGLLTDPDEVSDHDFRLASTLQDIFQVLAAPAENTRFPSTHDLVVQVSRRTLKRDRSQVGGSWTSATVELCPQDTKYHHLRFRTRCSIGEISLVGVSHCSTGSLVGRRAPPNKNGRIFRSGRDAKLYWLSLRHAT